MTPTSLPVLTGSGPGSGSSRRWHRGPLANRVLREMVLVTIGMCTLSVAMTWPALRDPAHTYLTTRIDPVYFMWAIAWAGHGLAVSPASVFDGNAFYPVPLSLAFSDSMLGYGPIALLGGRPGSVVVDYNVLFVAAPALTGVGGYALARQLGAGPLGAAAAGFGVAFAPWRAGQFDHLNVLSTGPFTASLAMLARGHGLSFGGRKGAWRPLWVAVGWLFAAWQVSIGFVIGLPFAYLLALIALVALAWWRLRQPSRPPRRLMAADLVGGALFCAVTALMSIPYLTVARTEAPAVLQTHNLLQVRMFAPTWRQLLEPPDFTGTWSWLTGQPVGTYPGSLERLVLPGYVLIALAVTGLFYSVWLVRWRVTLAAGIAVVTALTLGTHLPGNGEAGFVFLWRHAPGWSADRTPGRLIMFVTLGLALLAAGAVTRLAGQFALDGPQYRARALRLAAVAVLPLLVLAEGYYRVPVGTVPPVPAALQRAPGPLVVLPTSYEFDHTAMAWSAMTGFPEIGNGSGSITPDPVSYMRKELSHFPNSTSVAYLRSHGYRSVVVLKGLPPTPQVDPNRIPARSLGLRRINMGDSVLYLVEPRPLAQLRSLRWPRGRKS